MKPQFNEEVMLAGWSETHSGGAKVTFWLADSASLEAFKLMTVAKGKTAGQRLAMCLIEIGDDEQPKQTAEPKKEPLTGLAMLAVQWCKDPQFLKWLNLTHGNFSGEADAKSYILQLCHIRSRKELNTDVAAAVSFQAKIREPYMDWLGEQGAVAIR